MSVARTMPGARTTTRMLRCECGVEAESEETISSVTKSPDRGRARIPAAVVAAVLKRDHGVCSYCGGADRVGVSLVNEAPANATRLQLETLYQDVTNLAACCAKCGGAMASERRARRASDGRPSATGTLLVAANGTRVATRSPPVSTRVPPVARGVGGDPSGDPDPDLDPYGSIQESGSGSVGDLPSGGRARSYGARVMVTATQALTGEYLIARWSLLRADLDPRFMPWTRDHASGERAQRMAESIAETPDAVVDIDTTMKMLLQQASDGRAGDKSTTILKSVAFGFATWCTRFTSLREEMRIPAATGRDLDNVMAD